MVVAGPRDVRIVSRRVGRAPNGSVEATTCRRPELESDAASIAAADLPAEVEGRLRRLVETDTRAVAAMLPREDLELAFALAGWFVTERDGVLATEALGFHLDGTWHAVPDAPAPPDDVAR